MDMTRMATSTGYRRYEVSCSKTRISGAFFWVLNFENLYFLGNVTAGVFFGLLNKCCIFKCFISLIVYFLVQFYSPATSAFIVLHFYYILPNTGKNQCIPHSVKIVELL